MSSVLSRATVTAVGLTCKAALNTAFCSVAVNGLDNLKTALASPTRNNGQGVVTVSNHISTLDDPVTWGVLPASYYLSSRTTRWALGASDIMFTNPVFATFFRLGQTLETFRGKGVHQPAVDIAIQKLNQGDWVHLYGEGKVTQPEHYPRDKNGVASLRRFKWGVGRIIMETSTPPVVIPIWLTGFDKLMPEGRPFPYKYLPRPGAQLSVTFGSPIPSEEIQRALGEFGSSHRTPPDPPTPIHAQKPIGWIKDRLDKDVHPASIRDEELVKIRAAVTAIVQQAVESLGRSVCGDSLKR
ncbi:putative acyltransferase-domain-containing protein [Lyophyllum shimeji]|uniref:Tafazzin family protein n=1 Tax=Lyophyllum shimeji TaxID=47721 RepID=A0A9P3PDH9_LYOSH|nr:putative acyltransferase-domain-containing protein [Lyophyllum shimeji]